MAKAAAGRETEAWESAADLVAEYFTYDGGQDQGANIADLLLYWYKSGKILAFAPVNHRDPAAVNAAVQAFHGAYCGVNLTDDANDLFSEGLPWSVAGGEQPDPAGHVDPALALLESGDECVDALLDRAPAGGSSQISHGGGQAHRSR